MRRLSLVANRLDLDVNSGCVNRNVVIISLWVGAIDCDCVTCGVEEGGKVLRKVCDCVTCGVEKGGKILRDVSSLVCVEVSISFVEKEH